MVGSALVTIIARATFLSGDEIQRNFHKLESPHPDVGLLRVLGIFPTFSKDSSKLAFVDNEFKAAWVADSKGLRVVYEIHERSRQHLLASLEPKSRKGYIVC
ncbi:unnamed protein product [Camellia sinensis]